MRVCSYQWQWAEDQILPQGFLAQLQLFFEAHYAYPQEFAVQPAYITHIKELKRVFLTKASQQQLLLLLFPCYRALRIHPYPPRSTGKRNAGSRHN